MLKPVATIEDLCLGQEPVSVYRTAGTWHRDSEQSRVRMDLHYGAPISDLTELERPLKDGWQELIRAKAAVRGNPIGDYFQVKQNHDQLVAEIKNAQSALVQMASDRENFLKTHQWAQVRECETELERINSDIVFSKSVLGPLEADMNTLAQAASDLISTMARDYRTRQEKDLSKRLSKALASLPQATLDELFFCKSGLSTLRSSPFSAWIEQIDLLVKAPERIVPPRPEPLPQHLQPEVWHDSEAIKQARREARAASEIFRS